MRAVVEAATTHDDILYDFGHGAYDDGRHEGWSGMRFSRRPHAHGRSGCCRHIFRADDSATRTIFAESGLLKLYIDARCFFHQPIEADDDKITSAKFPQISRFEALHSADAASGQRIIFHQLIYIYDFQQSRRGLFCYQKAPMPLIFTRA